MTEEAQEWLNKAEADFETACRELAVELRTNFDAVCFHAQQCVEKWMKGTLAHRRIRTPYTHDLVALSGQLARVFETWSWDELELHRLTRGAVQFRYPMSQATRTDADQAIDIARRIRAALLALLSLPPTAEQEGEKTE